MKNVEVVISIVKDIVEHEEYLEWAKVYADQQIVHFETTIDEGSHINTIKDFFKTYLGDDNTETLYGGLELWKRL